MSGKLHRPVIVGEQGVSEDMAGAAQNDSQRATEFSDLLRDARNGSTEALGCLLAGFRMQLLAEACHNLEPEWQTKFAGSDVVQGTFLRAQRGFRDFAGEDESALYAWLRQVLRNHLANLRRSYQTDKRAIQRERRIGHSDSRHQKQPVPSAAELSPSSLCVRGEDADRLETAIGRLSADYQRVLRMRYWESLSFNIIASRLDRSTEATRKLWARALVALQRELD